MYILCCIYFKMYLMTSKNNLKIFIYNSFFFFLIHFSLNFEKVLRNYLHAAEYALKTSFLQFV